ncbi:unnamed protein product, partial [Symbiodinium sp. CCMP2456]
MDAVTAKPLLLNMSQHGNVQDIVAGIQTLLAKLLEEHERCEHEVRALRGGHPTSTSRVPPAVPSRTRASSDVEVQSLATEEIGPETADIPDSPDDGVCELPSVSKRELQEDGLDSELTPVKFSVYSVSLPNTEMSFGGDLAGQQCRVVFKANNANATTTREHAFQFPNKSQSSLPGLVPSAQGADLVVADWTAGTDVGMDCFMEVPKPCPHHFTAEVWASGHKFALASGTVTPGERRRVKLRGGGLLDVEVTVSKASTGSPLREKQVRDNIRARLERVLAEQHQTQVIMARDLMEAVKKCGKSQAAGFSYSLEEAELEDVILELRHIYQKHVLKVNNKKGLTKSKTPTHVIAFHQFLKCMFLEDVHKYARDEQTQLNLFILQLAIFGDEIPSTGTSGALVFANQKEQMKQPNRQKLIVDVMTALSTLAIISSVAATGISMDFATGAPGWIVLDTVCSTILAVEVIVKLYVLKPAVYFCGPLGRWNVFDLALSGTAVVETVISLSAGSGGAQSRVAMMLRGLRIARLARLAKLVRMPLLQELATIVSGFFISLRPLFWVLLTLFMVVYFMAVVLRTTLKGFTADSCHGDPDMFEDPDSEECPFHLVQGQVYCGDVLGCMFSVFRCILGDCTTKPGQSLVMVFSDGFGLGFDLIYAFGMVVVTFGLFNIITAIFVEATLRGLKASDRQQKFTRDHQSGWMTQQLAHFVQLATQEVQLSYSILEATCRTVYSTCLFEVMGRSLGLGETLRASAQTFSEGLDEDPVVGLAKEPWLR